MKKVFATLLILCFISCNQGTSKSNIFSNLKVTDNKNILDSWAMCATSGRDGLIQMNACPIITFTDNGMGYVTINSIVKESFTWKLEKVNMEIIYKNQNINSTFTDTNYYAEFSKEKDIMNLSLRHNDSYYYLSKLANNK